ncbi:hypothetical protein CapIbe_020257 [Capra ibex]
MGGFAVGSIKQYQLKEQRPTNNQHRALHGGPATRREEAPLGSQRRPGWREPRSQRPGTGARRVCAAVSGSPRNLQDSSGHLQIPVHPHISLGIRPTGRRNTAGSKLWAPETLGPTPECTRCS